jgi:AraC-like DNA-binding protein
VDVLADVVRRARATDGVFARSVLRPPWGLRFADAAPLSVEMVIRGHAWLLTDTQIPLQAGDLAIIQGSYVLADDPETEPGAVIYADGFRAAAGERPTHQPDRWRLPGPRTFGDPDGPTVIVRSAYQLHGNVSRRLLDVLPKALRVPADALPAAVRDLLDSEVGHDAPGQQAVLDRLLDLLLVLGLRAWFGTNAPPWYQTDPHVGRALQLLHTDPARPWTVATIAAEVGLSRAALARRFTERLGEPPMTYLTRWRIDLAADLLAESDLTLAAIAHQVGYADGFALSTAFKRLTGVSPAEHRVRTPRS